MVRGDVESEKRKTNNNYLDMDIAMGELTPKLQEEWQMYLNMLKEEEAMKAQANRKPMKDWSREEMESWLKGTHVAVISNTRGVLNKMSNEE